MKMLIYLIAFGSVMQTMAHEGHQAFYRLHVENGILVLHSKLELPDVKTVVTSANFCSEAQDFNFCANLWLIDKVSVRIDGKTQALTLESSTTENGHLIMVHSLGKAPPDFKKIELDNTAFTKAFKHYDNIVEIEISNQKQGYKLTKARTSISFQTNS